MLHRMVLATLAIALTCWLASSSAGAASFDVAIFHTERDALAEAFKFWAAEIDKRTQGRVQFKPSYSGALTSAVETLGAVRNGVVPVGLTAASFGSGAMPALGYLEAIGGLPNDADQMRKALDGVQRPLADLLQKYGVELMFTQPTFELVVDCALSVPNLVLSLKLHEVAPKLTALRQAVNLSILVMNRRTWRSISAQDQTTIGAVSTEARQRSITNMRAVAAKGLADLKGLGSDIYALNDAELKAMKEKMKPVFDKIAEGSGEAGKPFAEQLKPYW